MRKQNLKVVYVKTNELVGLKENPRIWNRKATRDLKTSIRRFGIVDALICSSNPKRKNVILGGNFRWKVAKDLGIKEVPVIYLNIDRQKERELSLRLNRNLGEWDMEALKNLDFEMLLDVGFDDSDFENIWGDTLDVENDEFSVEREIQKIKTPKTQLGDIFALGNHRLGCFDSTDEALVKKFLGTNRVDMIYCDPIYNIALSYDKGLSAYSKYGGSTNDHKTDEEYKEFLKKTMINALGVAKKDCHIFYYCDQKYVGLIQNLYQELGIKTIRTCLWIKNGFNPTPGVAFNKSYEPVVYGTKGKPFISPKITNLSEVLNKEIASGNRQIDDILDMLDIWLVKRLPGNQYEHPTEKPPTLHEKALRRCTKINDIVLDLFSGSGSTLISCEQLKRRCFTVDIDPIFCDLVIRRYEQFGGNKAKLIGNIKEATCK